MAGDEDELMAACQDVVRGIETGDVSKEDVRKVKAEVRKVSAAHSGYCKAPWEAHLWSAFLF